MVPSLTRTNEKAPEKVFFSGVLLLTLSTLSVKAVGLLWKLPMLSLLGADGMGYFNSAYEIYATFCVVATAGIPVALSVLISSALAGKGEREAETVYRTARNLLLALGGVGTAAMGFFAGGFCRLIGNENARLCLISLAPTALFVCHASALRGFFQGHQKMLPTALSQFLEAFGKLTFGLVFAWILKDRGAGTPTIAAGAGLGVSVGSLLSDLYLIRRKRRFDRAPANRTNRRATASRAERRRILGSLARIAIPVTLGAALGAAARFSDLLLLLRRLQDGGYTQAAANEIYGSYTTLSLSLFGVLPALINAIVLPLTPLLSAAVASGDRAGQGRLLFRALHLTAFLAVPASFVFSAFSEPILGFLFPHAADAVRVAAPLLAYLGASLLFSCLVTSTGAILQAMGQAEKPIFSLALTMPIKIAVTAALIPSVGAAGATVGTFVCTALTVLCNLFFIARRTELPTAAGILLRPILCGTISVGLSLLCFFFLGERVSPAARICLSLLLCLGFYLFCETISGDFPIDSCFFGKKAKKLLHKRK